MRRRLLVLAVSLLAGVFLEASAVAQVASWRQVVGIVLANNVVGVGTGMITGGFLPWTTTSGTARVNLQNGFLHFEVRGLVFAAAAKGITLGTPGPITAVKGTLICDADGSASNGNSVIVESPSVTLSPTGDASFSGSLGALPDVCSSEPDLVFVIRASVVGGNAVEGPWLANGAVLSKNTEHGHDRD